MATNKRALVERMETQSKYARHNTQHYALVETILVLLFALLVCGGVLWLNALLPKGW